MPFKTTTTCLRLYAAAFGLLFATAVERAGAATISEISVPSANSLPTGIAAGPDGNLWFTERGTGKIGRITTAGVITEFKLPMIFGQPYDVALGSDGNLWFTEFSMSRIGRITPAGVITEYFLPRLGSQPMGITAGPDGNLWFTEHAGNRIGRITPAGVIAEFLLPLQAQFPRGITAGPDGKLWFTLATGNRIGRITTVGQITLFPIPASGTEPFDIAPGSDGNLWFTQHTGNRVARITPGGVVTQYTLPTLGAAPAQISAGTDGSLWFTEESANQIGRITTAGAITEFRLPTAGSLPAGIAPGPDGRLWFAQGAGRIGKLSPEAAKGDFNGDGQSDLVLRNIASGVLNQVWMMNGAVRESFADVVPDASSPDWLIRGIDDFDSASRPGAGPDGLSDLVFWNRVTGEVEFWLMNGMARVDPAMPLTGAVAPPPTWSLAATADFNHDGKPDLLWQDLVGLGDVIWTMDGTVKTGEIVPSPQLFLPDWTIAAAGDYNGDGNTDLLWYSSYSNRLVTWYLDANAVRLFGQYTLPATAASPDWKVVACADYSNSSVGVPPMGSPDIVWRDSVTGDQRVWHMDFASVSVLDELTTPSANTPLPLDWEIAGPR